MHPLVAVPATGALIWRAYTRKSLTTAGIITATLTAIIHALHPWSIFFALLGVFFLCGTAVTKVKHNVKARLTISSSGASGGEGARTHIQVLANSLVASVLILAHLRQLSSADSIHALEQGCWQYGHDLLVVGIVSHYAAVTADTFSSELGILSKHSPRLLTSWNFRKVPPGTNGGITVLGTMAGFLGAAIIALTSLILLPFCSVSAKPGMSGRPGLQGGNGWTQQEKSLWFIGVTIWGGLGSLLDSALGGWFQASVIDTRTGKVVEGDGGKKVAISTHSKGHHNSSRRVESGIGFLDNNAVNFVMALLMSIGGMAIAGFLWSLP